MTKPLAFLHSEVISSEVSMNLHSYYIFQVEELPFPVLPPNIHLNFTNSKLLAATWNVSSAKMDVLFLRLKDIYLSHIQHYEEAIYHAKSSYNTSIIKCTDENTRTLFSILHNIIKPPDTFAIHTHSAAVCNKFMDFFKYQNC